MVLGKIQKLSDLDASLEVTIDEALRAPAPKQNPVNET